MIDDNYESLNELADKDHDGIPDRIDSSYSLPERDELLKKDLEQREEENRHRSRNNPCR